MVRNTRLVKCLVISCVANGLLVCAVGSSSLLHPANVTELLRPVPVSSYKPRPLVNKALAKRKVDVLPTPTPSADSSRQNTRSKKSATSANSATQTAVGAPAGAKAASQLKKLAEAPKKAGDHKAASEKKLAKAGGHAKEHGGMRMAKAPSHAAGGASRPAKAAKAGGAHERAVKAKRSEASAALRGAKAKLVAARAAQRNAQVKVAAARRALANAQRSRETAKNARIAAAQARDALTQTQRQFHASLLNANHSQQNAQKLAMEASFKTIVANSNADLKAKEAQSKDAQQAANQAMTAATQALQEASRQAMASSAAQKQLLSKLNDLARINQGKSAAVSSGSMATGGQEIKAESQEKPGEQEQDKQPKVHKPVTRIVLKTIKMWAPKPGQKLNLPTNLEIVLSNDLKVIPGPPLDEDQLAQLAEMMAHRNLQQVKMNHKQLKALLETRRESESRKPKPKPKSDENTDAADDGRHREAKKPEAHKTSQGDHKPKDPNANLKRPQTPFQVKQWDTDMSQRWAMRHRDEAEAGTDDSTQNPQANQPTPTNSNQPTSPNTQGANPDAAGQGAMPNNPIVSGGQNPLTAQTPPTGNQTGAQNGNEQGATAGNEANVPNGGATAGGTNTQAGNLGQGENGTQGATGTTPEGAQGNGQGNSQGNGDGKGAAGTGGNEAGNGQGVAGTGANDAGNGQGLAGAGGNGTGGNGNGQGLTNQGGDGKGAAGAGGGDGKSAGGNGGGSGNGQGGKGVGGGEGGGEGDGNGVGGGSGSGGGKGVGGGSGSGGGKGVGGGSGSGNGQGVGSGSGSGSGNGQGVGSGSGSGSGSGNGQGVGSGSGSGSGSGNGQGVGSGGDGPGSDGNGGGGNGIGEGDGGDGEPGAEYGGEGAAGALSGEGGDGAGWDTDIETRDDGTGVNGKMGDQNKTEVDMPPDAPIGGHTIPGGLVLPPVPPVGTENGKSTNLHPVSPSTIQVPTPQRKAVPARNSVPPISGDRSPEPMRRAIPPQKSNPTRLAMRPGTQKVTQNTAEPQMMQPAPQGQPQRPVKKAVPRALTIGSTSSRGTVAFTVMPRPFLPLGSVADTIDPTLPPANGVVKSKTLEPRHEATPTVKPQPVGMPARPVFRVAPPVPPAHPKAVPGIVAHKPVPALQAHAGQLKLAHNSEGVKEGTEQPLPAAPLPGNMDQIGDGSGLKGDYYLGNAFNEFIFSRADANINFTFSSVLPNHSPNPRIPPFADYTARWTGRIAAQHSETYTFYAAVDDGIRVWIDHKLVLDQWGPHSPIQFSSHFTFEAGRQYLFKCEYLATDGGTSLIHLYWESPSTPKQFVPQDSFFYPLATDEVELEKDKAPLR